MRAHVIDVKHHAAHLVAVFLNPGCHSRAGVADGFVAAIVYRGSHADCWLSFEADVLCVMIVLLAFQHGAQLLRIGLMQKSGNGRKAKAHSPIHIDFTGCKKLLLSVKPVASDWIYSLRTAEQVCSLLEAAWSSETLDEAAGQVAAAHRIWEKNRGISASLVDHERLEDVDEGFSDLQAWLQLGEESEFARTCLSLVKQIRAMAESEKPYYYNIL